MAGQAMVVLRALFRLRKESGSRFARMRTLAVAKIAPPSKIARIELLSFGVPE